MLAGCKLRHRSRGSCSSRPENAGSGSRATRAALICSRCSRVSGAKAWMPASLSPAHFRTFKSARLVQPDSACTQTKM